MPLEPTGLARSVIPRWRLSKQLEAAPEALAVLGRRAALADSFSDIHSVATSFLSGPNIGLAGELLSAAIVEGDAAASRAAADYVLRSGKSGAILAQIAKRVLEGQSEVVQSTLSISADVGIDKQKMALALAAVRARVRSGSAGPLTWLDLGYLHSLQGDLVSARRAVLTSLKLGGASRVIRRSAARFFVHDEDFDMALRVVDRAPMVKADPWLLSAHIAIASAAGKRSKHIGLSLREVKRDAFAPVDSSELLAALATEEFLSGAIKKVKVLSRKALEAPTENTLAQLTWIDGVGKLKLVEDSFVSSFQNAHEARARVNYAAQDWLGSCEAAWYWLADQPFSERAALFGSFVSLVLLDDPSQSVFFCVAGLRANPKSFMLLNNLAVAQLLGGYTSAAAATLKKSPAPDGQAETIVWLATQGLARFREGNHEEGRRLYDLSNDLARKTGETRSIALNRMFLAKEEFRVGNNDAFFKCCTDMAAALRASGSEYASAIAKEIEEIKSLGFDPVAASRLGSMIGRLVDTGVRGRGAD